ncbi:MAG: hypothetical protein HFG58_16585 [Lachnospiraceae bacterium]|nr:hypothetical protein [Lachnospiraceae bacterium]
MVTLNGIKKSLTRLIGEAFLEANVFTEDIEQIGTADGKAFPLIHIQLNLQGSELAMGADTRDKTVLVDITYMEESRSSNQTLYDVQERLELAIGGGFFCGNRYLHVESISGNIADDLLHVTFSVTFNDGIPQAGETFDLFEELEIRM